jgi:hypothetical protein
MSLAFESGFRSTRGYDNVLSILELISLLMLAAISFALRRTDQQISRIGLVTIIAVFLIAALFPAL